jgi:hypothetical protein
MRVTIEEVEHAGFEHEQILWNGAPGDELCVG